MSRFATICVAMMAAIAIIPYSDAQGQVFKGCCVAIALDESTSLTDAQFETTTAFASDIIRNFDRFGRPDGESAAVCKFSTGVQEVFRLRTHGTDKNAAADEVNDLLLDGGITNTHLAIDKLNEFLGECDPSYNKAGLIITDGNSENPGDTLEAANTFKREGYILIVVGIGIGINHNELRRIATPSFYFPVADFQSLSRIRNTIETVLCS